MRKYSDKLNILKSFISGISLILIGFCATGCEKGKHSHNGTNTIECAELLAIYERDGYDEVYIVNPKGNEVAHYIIVDRDDTIPEVLPEGAIVLMVPLGKVVLDSEIYASAFEELGACEYITGMFDVNYITSPGLRSEYESGKIADVGQTMNPNVEKLVSLQPDGIFLSYFEGMQTQGIDKTGVPVIKMYDLQESTPLGRAEWLRLIGRLTGKAELSDSIYEEVKERYRAVKGQANASNSELRPKVLSELIYEGTWAVPGGDSYQAALINDAGGNYFMSGDRKSVTLNLSPEQVVVEGGDADVWLIRYFGDEDQLKAILGSDPLYAEIKAFRNGNVYFSDTSKSALFREFPFHPDLLLEDYSIIFSGDTLSPLRYYRRLN